MSNGSFHTQILISYSLLHVGELVNWKGSGRHQSTLTLIDALCVNIVLWGQTLWAELVDLSRSLCSQSPDAGLENMDKIRTRPALIRRNV